METKTLTEKEAIEQGYTDCTLRFHEYIAVPIMERDKDKAYVLIGRELTPYQISDDLLAEMLDDHFCNQDEVENEGGDLEYSVKDIDFSDITAKINTALCAVKFKFATDILITE